MARIASLFLLGFLQIGIAEAQWSSDILYYGEDGALVYETDDGTPNGYRIPDFSYAGYQSGAESIPEARDVVTLRPAPGDDTRRIQGAIDAVSQLERGLSGMRGAVRLAAGEYQVSGTLELKASGVVLRGAGDGSDPRSNTVIQAVGKEQYDVLHVGGGYQKWTEGRDRTTPITRRVRAGERTLHVPGTEGYRVGDTIVLYHPCTDDWLEEVDFGGTRGWSYKGSARQNQGWTCGDRPGSPYGNDMFDLVYNRRIMALGGSTITIDAPVFSDLDPALSPDLHLYKLLSRKIASHVGVEDLRVDIQTEGGDDEEHAWIGIYLRGVDNGWLRDVTVLHFGRAGIKTQSATRVTLERVKALDPVSVTESTKQYNFDLGGYSQLVLIRDSHARNGRHHFVASGGTLVSGNVMLRTKSEGACSASEGHNYWVQGLLFDNHVERGHRARTGPCSVTVPKGAAAADWSVGLYNRGAWNDHGWSTVYSVAWNVDVGNSKLSVQRPPSSQNFSVGSRSSGPHGDVSGYGPWMDPRTPCTYDNFKSRSCEPEGYIEGTNRQGLVPASLYEAQLADRGYSLQ